MEQTYYMAVYNKQDDIYTQNGDEIDDLDEACQMEATFTYSSDVQIEFEHKMAVMTFSFESADRPAKLVFENGEETYTVNYTTIEAEDGIYTSHIMINPCDGDSRDLTFTLYNSGGVAYDIRTVPTSVAYEVGYRYTAPVSSLTNSVWNGSGTEADPYTISSVEELSQLATIVNAGITYSDTYFELTKDLDLEGSEENQWPAIGINASTSSNTGLFGGVFDGGGKTISGLYINETLEQGKALFGYTYGATIKNLTVKGSVTAPTYYVAGVVGYAQYTTISNCINEVDVTAIVESVNYYYGGVVAYAKYCTIEECVNRGAVYSDECLYGGGICGAVNETTINRCYNDGEITGANYIGGVVGYFSAKPICVVNCYNTGDVTATSGSAGGGVGYNTFSTNTVLNCYNSGVITSKSSSYGYIGGIVGYISYGDVQNCYSRGAIAGDYKYAGSIAGQKGSSASVSDCYFDGTVFSTAVGMIYGTVGTVDGTSTASEIVAALNANVVSYNDPEDSDDAPAIEWCEWGLDGGYPVLIFE